MQFSLRSILVSGMLTNYCILIPHWSTAVAVRSKAEVGSRSSARIAGSNSTEDMNVRLLCLLCVVQVVASATR